MVDVMVVHETASEDVSELALKSYLALPPEAKLEYLSLSNEDLFNSVLNGSGVLTRGFDWFRTVAGETAEGVPDEALLATTLAALAGAQIEMHRRGLTTQDVEAYARKRAAEE